VSEIEREREKERGEEEGARQSKSKRASERESESERERARERERERASTSRGVASGAIVPHKIEHVAGVFDNVPSILVHTHFDEHISPQQLLLLLHRDTPHASLHDHCARHQHLFDSHLKPFTIRHFGKNGCFHRVLQPRIALHYIPARRRQRRFVNLLIQPIYLALVRPLRRGSADNTVSKHTRTQRANACAHSLLAFTLRVQSSPMCSMPLKYSGP